MPIEGRVMQLAERESVGNDRLAVRLRVAAYVRGIEQFHVPQTTERALLAICAQHTLAEDLLMQPAAEQRCHVSPARILATVEDGGVGRVALPRGSGRQRLRVVDRNSEGQSRRIVGDDKDRPLRQVSVRD
jgi:hypothetical protein